VLGRPARFLDERLGLARFARSSLNKVFPGHWSFLLGEVAFYSFVVLLVTGLFLTFFFHPSLQDSTYHGLYQPLNGTHMSSAYNSVVTISFDVRAGLVMRQIHHWAALVFVGAIVLHLCRIFFTGAYRRPREINWLVGVTMLLLAIGNGFTGYSLPDDLLSGTGLRIMDSIVLSIPLVGERLSFLIFGGEFPAQDIISRLFVIHILVVPAALVGLLSVHLAIVWRQKHTQFPGDGAREDNVVGSRLWPTYAAKSVGLLVLVAGVLGLLGGIAQINPVWLYGPYQPAAVSTAAQPDYYVGFLEGALRLFPPWDLTVFGFTIPEVFWPGVLLPAIVFGSLFVWPFVDRRFTRDRAEHHILDRPRDRPGRTALGATALTFMTVLTVAGGQDLVSQWTGVDVTAVVWTLRALVLVLPLVVGAITWRVCADLRRDAPIPRVDHEGEPVDERPANPPAPDDGADASTRTAAARGHPVPADG
jgi:ubiquinol-cytochrome c reductase cytochrome b subunit